MVTITQITTMLTITHTTTGTTTNTTYGHINSRHLKPKTPGRDSYPPLVNIIRPEIFRFFKDEFDKRKPTGYERQL